MGLPNAAGPSRTLCAFGGGHDALGDGFEDLLVDLVDREVALDEDDAVRLARGDGAVLLPDAAEEGIFLRLEAVFAGAGFSLDAIVAAARAGQ